MEVESDDRVEYQPATAPPPTRTVASRPMSAHQPYNQRRQGPQKQNHADRPISAKPNLQENKASASSAQILDGSSSSPNRYRTSPDRNYFAAGAGSGVGAYQQQVPMPTNMAKPLFSYNTAASSSTARGMMTHQQQQVQEMRKTSRTYGSGSAAAAQHAQRVNGSFADHLQAVSMKEPEAPLAPSVSSQRTRPGVGSQKQSNEKGRSVSGREPTGKETIPQSNTAGPRGKQHQQPNFRQVEQNLSSPNKQFFFSPDTFPSVRTGGHVQPARREPDPTTSNLIFYHDEPEDDVFFDPAMEPQEPDPGRAAKKSSKTFRYKFGPASTVYGKDRTLNYTTHLTDIAHYRPYSAQPVVEAKPVSRPVSASGYEDGGMDVFMEEEPAPHGHFAHRLDPDRPRAQSEDAYGSGGAVPGSLQVRMQADRAYSDLPPETNVFLEPAGIAAKAVKEPNETGVQMVRPPSAMATAVAAPAKPDAAKPPKPASKQRQIVFSDKTASSSASNAAQPPSNAAASSGYGLGSQRVGIQDILAQPEVQQNVPQVRKPPVGKFDKAPPGGDPQNPSVLAIRPSSARPPPPNPKMEIKLPPTPFHQAAKQLGPQWTKLSRLYSAPPKRPPPALDPGAPLERVIPEPEFETRMPVNKRKLVELQQAALAGDRRLVKAYCITNKKYLHCTDDDGFTPLHYAAIGGSGECFRQMLYAGADPEHFGRGRWTAAHAAAANEQTHVLQVIKEECPEMFSFTDDKGWTPLEWLRVVVAKTSKGPTVGKTQSARNRKSLLQPEVREVSRFHHPLAHRDEKIMMSRSARQGKSARPGIGEWQR